MSEPNHNDTNKSGSEKSTLDEIREHLIDKLKETKEFQEQELLDIDALLKEESIKADAVTAIFQKKEDENS